MGRVLIIDDDKELCSLMKKCIGQENLSVLIAYSGILGLRLAEENQDSLSLVILDVMMPDLISNAYFCVFGVHDIGTMSFDVHALHITMRKRIV